MQEDLPNRILLKLFDIDERMATLATEADLTIAHNDLVTAVNRLFKK